MPPCAPGDSNAERLRKRSPAASAYYNLPATSLESYDDDETAPPRYYWELHVAADPATPRPRADDVAHWLTRGVSLDEAIDGAIADTLAQQRRRSQSAQLQKERLWENLADLGAILPRRVMTGSRMRDDLWECGGRARELAEALSGGLISHDQLATAVGRANQARRPVEQTKGEG